MVAAVSQPLGASNLLALTLLSVLQQHDIFQFCCHSSRSIQGNPIESQHHGRLFGPVLSHIAALHTKESANLAPFAECENYQGSLGPSYKFPADIVRGWSYFRGVVRTLLVGPIGEYVDRPWEPLCSRTIGDDIAFEVMLSVEYASAATSRRPPRDNQLDNFFAELEK